MLNVSEAIEHRRPDWHPRSNSAVCGRHFAPEMFDRTGQTVRLREGAVPTVFEFTGNQKPLVVGQKAYERSAVPTVTRPKRILMRKSDASAVRAAAKAIQAQTSAATYSLDVSGQPERQQYVLQKRGGRVYGVRKIRPKKQTDDLVMSNVLFLNPDTNRVSVVQVSSENETELQQLLGDTVVTPAASGTAPVAGTSESINADHSYSTDSNTAGLVSASQGMTSSATVAGTQNTSPDHNYTTSSDMRCNNAESSHDADVPSEASNDDDDVAMDSPHVTGDESGNVNGDMGTSPAAGDESPSSARTPMTQGADRCYSRGAARMWVSRRSYNVGIDHQYLAKNREDILMEKLAESRARNAEHRRKNKLLQLKVKRLKARVTKLKEDLKTAKKNTTVSLLKSAVLTVQKNSPNALRVLLPKDNNVAENVVMNFTAT